MKNIKTVTLEFLRSGPSHNQLLSPLTQYLALAGHHEAVTVRVPYEHQDFLTRLQFLRYSKQDTPHKKQILKEISRDLGKVLGSVPGLNADLEVNDPNQETLVHLRLIFSASELAMLPFEMSDSPSGYPGEGRPLSLQLDTPLVITRELRNAQGFHADWTRKPKILFIAASPAGVGTIPFKAHLLALRKAIDPWLYAKRPNQTDAERLAEQLVILPQANLQLIQEACETNRFTHIHILAHGLNMPDHGTRFGLALHDVFDYSKTDIVDGDRLAVALRCHQRNHAGLAHPNLVTLASCDSGHQGSILVPGGSLAHALHNSGIPMVIASQFPLTKRGSVSLVQDFYSKVLWGQDPRICLHEIRHNLRKLDSKTHDWASLIAFVSLPDNFDQQLLGFRSNQADRAIQATLDLAHHIVEDQDAQDREIMLDDDMLHRLTQRLAKAIQFIPESKEQSEEPLRYQMEQSQEILGRLGSAEKRTAQIFFERAKILTAGSESHRKDIRQKIHQYQHKREISTRMAMNYYHRAYKIHGDNHWGGTQYLSLRMVLELNQMGVFEFPNQLWTRLRIISNEQTKIGPKEKRAWAFVSLAELDLLRLAKTSDPCSDSFDSWQVAIGKVIKLMDRRSFHCNAAMFQARRYKRDHFLFLTERVAIEAEKMEDFLKVGPGFQPIYRRFPST